MGIRIVSDSSSDVLAIEGVDYKTVPLKIMFGSREYVDEIGTDVVQMVLDLQPFTGNIVSLTFPDHHQFRKKDIRRINETFAAMPSPKLIITTEKDNARLFGNEGLSDEVRQNIFMMPVEVEFLLDQQDLFNEKIIGYVRKNSRNSILAQAKDDHKSDNRNRTGNRSRTISFRNN